MVGPCHQLGHWPPTSFPFLNWSIPAIRKQPWAHELVGLFQAEYPQILSQQKQGLTMLCVAWMPTLWAPHAGHPVGLAVSPSGESVPKLAQSPGQPAGSAAPRWASNGCLPPGLQLSLDPWSTLRCCLMPAWQGASPGQGWSCREPRPGTDLAARKLFLKRRRKRRSKEEGGKEAYEPRGALRSTVPTGPHGPPQRSSSRSQRDCVFHS